MEQAKQDNWRNTNETSSGMICFVPWSAVASPRCDIIRICCRSLTRKVWMGFLFVWATCRQTGWLDEEHILMQLHWERSTECFQSKQYNKVEAALLEAYKSLPEATCRQRFQELEENGSHWPKTRQGNPNAFAAPVGNSSNTVPPPRSKAEVEAPFNVWWSWVWLSSLPHQGKVAVRILCSPFLYSLTQGWVFQFCLWACKQHMHRGTGCMWPVV